MPLSPEAIRAIQDSVATITGVQLGPADTARLHALLASADTLSAHRADGYSSRMVTILLTDLRGFTAYSEGLPASTVFDVLNRYLGRMCEIAVSNGGIIDKFMGDSVMVLFGALEHGENDAFRAVTCAVQMQIAMDEINSDNAASGLAPLHMGVGIHTGRVVAGLLGSKLHSEFTVIGQEVSLASRIESFSLRGQVLISEATFALCAGLLETAEPLDVQVKGKQDLMRVPEVFAIPSLGLKVPRKDERRSPRVDVRFPVGYRLIADKIVLPDLRKGVVLDLGYQGMRVEIGRKLDRYDDIVLDFDLPLFGQHATGVYAKVRNIRPERDTHLAGLEFTSIGVHDEQAIRHLVQFLMQGSPTK